MDDLAGRRPMSQLAVVPPVSEGPVHRSIVAVDVEGSTKRTNPAKGKLRLNITGEVSEPRE